MFLCLSRPVIKSFGRFPTKFLKISKSWEQQRQFIWVKDETENLCVELKAFFKARAANGSLETRFRAAVTRVDSSQVVNRKTVKN